MRPIRYILSEDGTPVPCNDIAQWGACFNDKDKRRVAFDALASGVEVSTVFLGLDHSQKGGGPPVLWETMVFGGPHDQYQERYTSHAAALAGRQRAVAMVRDTGSIDHAERRGKRVAKRKDTNR